MNWGERKKNNEKSLWDCLAVTKGQELREQYYVYVCVFIFISVSNINKSLYLCQINIDLY